MGGVGGSQTSNPLSYGPLATPTYKQYAPDAPLGTPTTYSAPKIGAPAAVGMSFDLSTDPVLQEAKAMADNQRAAAESGALKFRKQLAVGYGDSAYGKTIDAATGQAAEQNPFSILANLRNDYTKNQGTMEEDLNAHNFFYGGARIKALAGALHDYQGQQAGAAGAEQHALGNIDQNRIAALMAADQSEQGAYESAYNRALQIALAGGYPGSAPPPGAPAATTAPAAAPYGQFGSTPGGVASGSTYGGMSPANPIRIGRHPRGDTESVARERLHTRDRRGEDRALD